jgi:hypothetical protein
MKSSRFARFASRYMVLAICIILNALFGIWNSRFYWMWNTESRSTDEKKTEHEGPATSSDMHRPNVIFPFFKIIKRWASSVHLAGTQHRLTRLCNAQFVVRLSGDVCRSMPFLQLRVDYYVHSLLAS